MYSLQVISINIATSFQSWNESKQWYATIKTYKIINISVEYQCFYTKPSEQGSFFWAGRNESKQWYAMFKTYKNINISAQYQYFCTKPSEQGSFFWTSLNESTQWYVWSKPSLCYDEKWEIKLCISVNIYCRILKIGK